MCRMDYYINQFHKQNGFRLLFLMILVVKQSRQVLNIFEKISKRIAEKVEFLVIYYQLLSRFFLIAKIIDTFEEGF